MMQDKNFYTKQTEALKLALEALEFNCISSEDGEDLTPSKTKKAITAIQEALMSGTDGAEGCQCPACKVMPHASDCAVHNEPAYTNGSCDCGAELPAQPSKPLVDEQIDRAIAELGLNYFADHATNRAVLRELCRKAAHGIKEKNA